MSKQYTKFTKSNAREIRVEIDKVSSSQLVMKDSNFTTIISLLMFISSLWIQFAGAKSEALMIMSLVLTCLAFVMIGITKILEKLEKLEKMGQSKNTKI